MKKICIFGAGIKGNELYEVVSGWNTVVCFIDNDVNKQGRKYRDKVDIISFQEFLNSGYCRQCDLVVSTYVKDIENQLKRNGLEYWTFYSGDKCYFDRADVNEARDFYLVENWKFKPFNSCKIFDEYMGNWFRKEFFDERNKELVSRMRAGEDVELPSDIYFKIYPDELFENRPGMRLVYRLIRECCQPGASIVDLGCGHGFLLQKLNEHNLYNLIAFEGSECRGRYLREQGYNTIVGNICDTGIEDGSFDAVTCLEVLEHVSDIDKAILEIYRILKPAGFCWITVPEGKYCDCFTHVRHFTVNSLSSAFMAHGFRVDCIQEIPCHNSAIDGQIIMQCRK